MALYCHALKISVMSCNHDQGNRRMDWGNGGGWRTFRSHESLRNYPRSANRWIMRNDSCFRSSPLPCRRTVLERWPARCGMQHERVLVEKLSFATSCARTLFFVWGGQVHVPVRFCFQTCWVKTCVNCLNIFDPDSTYMLLFYRFFSFGKLANGVLD
jgi:hypothetical protein